MLSKDDVALISNLLKPIQDDIRAVKVHNLRIENRIIDLKQTFETNLLKWKSELFTKIDNVMARLEKAELENVFLKAKEPKSPN